MTSLIIGLASNKYRLKHPTHNRSKLHTDGLLQRNIFVKLVVLILTHTAVGRMRIQLRYERLGVKVAKLLLMSKGRLNFVVQQIENDLR